MKNYILRSLNLQSLSHSFRGLWIATSSEKNLQLEIILSIVFSFFILLIEQYPLLLVNFALSSMVIGLEIVNTAIEKMCDFLYPNQHKSIRDIKDIAASAVLFSALIWFSLIGFLLISKIF